MPLNYLEQSGGNYRTAAGMGSSMANVVHTQRMLPLMQMQLQLRQQALMNQARVQAAQIGLANARSTQAQNAGLLSLIRAQAAQKNIQDAIDLGDSMAAPYYGMKNGQGPTVDNAQNASLANSLGNVIAKSPGDAVKQTFQFQEGMRDPTMKKLIATGQHPFMNVPQEGTLYDVTQPNQIVGLGSPKPITLGPQQEAYIAGNPSPIAQNFQIKPSAQGRKPSDQLILDVARQRAKWEADNNPTTNAPDFKGVLGMTNLLSAPDAMPQPQLGAPAPVSPGLQGNKSKKTKMTYNPQTDSFE